jgi:hypothetical protein
VSNHPYPAYRPHIDDEARAEWRAYEKASRRAVLQYRLMPIAAGHAEDVLWDIEDQTQRTGEN